MQQKLDAWIQQQKQGMTWLCLKWKSKLKWPWEADKRDKQKLQEEYNRRRYQLQVFCNAVKAETVSDLQDILCAMVLSECVYKKPASEVVRAVNKFKADFGGQVISLECIQPSLEHVPHRYLLAEAGDTLFASFIGTKQYKDFMADANILQGAIFHDDTNYATCNEGSMVHSCDQEGSKDKLCSAKAEVQKGGPKPAAHKGFLTRAKGIPALELYRLAKKKDRRLVLCGHSLGGAVAVLATLTILRFLASSLSSKDGDKFQVKCITFSQPPVGNAALRDYVQRKGWQRHFRTYCIPEDLVPRILSPAYFQHYRAQAAEGSSDGDLYKSSSGHASNGFNGEVPVQIKPKPNEEQCLVLGLGPVQKSLHMFSRIVPIINITKQSNLFGGMKKDTDATSTDGNSVITSTMDEVESSAQSLEIEESVDGISLVALSDVDKISTVVKKNTLKTQSRETNTGESTRWHRVPSLPSYVPFGELYLLEKSSVEPLSASEYTKLTSVQSVLAELRERFQSHSMRSYRSRFQKIYDLCMGNNAASILGMEPLPNLPHLQQWLGLAVSGVVELGHIAEPLTVRTATSLVPLGWNGMLGEKNGSEPLRVDVHGYGLHQCTLVRAQVNGRWCSTIVESLPSPPLPSSNYEPERKLQKMQILIGAPLKQASTEQINSSLIASGSVIREGFAGSDADSPHSPLNLQNGPFGKTEKCPIESLREVMVHCTSDFMTASKEVSIRLRRVQLLGLKGAGKTSLFYALLGLGRGTTAIRYEGMLPDTQSHEGVAGGICFIDSAGVNLQELHVQVVQLKQELSAGFGELKRKIDLVIHVHNLSHKVPQWDEAHTTADTRPALSVLIDEVAAAGIPSILAITNKFAVSADQQNSTANAAMEAYRFSPNMSVLINSCPYTTHGSQNVFHACNSFEVTSKELTGNKNIQRAAHKIVLAPMNLIQMSLRKKEVVLPVEGVETLQKLVHKVLLSHEESAFQEFARERLLIEEVKEQRQAAEQLRFSQCKPNSIVSALVGASFGAGLGIVMAVIMGAASAFRKP